MKKILTAAIILSLLAFVKFRQEGKFKDYAKNPVVLAPGAAGEWDAGAIGSVSVIKVNNLYHLYYEAWGQLSKGGTRQEYESLQIGHATSTDGIHWKKDPANPVVKRGEAGEWDRDGTWDPFVIYENGMFKLWFGGGNESHCDWGYATSADGSHFEKKGQISHLGNVEDDHVVHNAADGRYYMFYWDRARASWDSIMRGGDHQPSGLFVAVSNDETHFDFDHAIRIKVAGQQWPVKYSHVIREGNEWIMFYGKAVTRGHSSSTGIATSTDLFHWIKRVYPIVNGHDAEILKTGKDSWNLYYAPDGFFDMPGADVRLATYRGKLSGLFEE
jgi:hypothetical protein